MTFEFSGVPKKTLTFDDLNLNDRYDLLDSLPKTYQMGVEIGVWQGWYTNHLIQRTSMSIVGIDEGKMAQIKNAVDNFFNELETS